MSEGGWVGDLEEQDLEPKWHKLDNEDKGGEGGIMQERQGGLRIPPEGGRKHGVLSHLLLKYNYLKKYILTVKKSERNTDGFKEFPTCF